MLFERPGLCIVSARFQRRGQMPDGERHHQHDSESHQILHVVYGKRELWRHKQEVKQRYAQKRGDNRRATAKLHCDHDDCQQKQHHDIGKVKPLRKRPGHQRGERA